MCRVQVLDGAHAAATEEVADVSDAPAATPRPTAPVTVGMSRRAELEAKRAWRLELQGRAMEAPAPLIPLATPAGVKSAAAFSTIRGHVGPLDHESAADYNLQACTPPLALI